MTESEHATKAALQRLVDHGSDLTRPMEMDFFVAVPDEAAARVVAERARTLGYVTAVSMDRSGPDWTCTCTRTIVPEYETVREIEETLDALGRDVGGHADGFGSFGNKDETN